jgi:hypothetical protein
VERRAKISKSKVKCKAGAFADSVNAMWSGDWRSVQRVLE